MSGPKPRPLTDQQIAEAQAMYEAGELSISEIAARCGTHYMRIVGLAAKHGWFRPSTIEQIDRARRITARGLPRRALQYLRGLVPTGIPDRDDEIVIETRRISLTLQRRVLDSARAADRG